MSGADVGRSRGGAGGRATGAARALVLGLLFAAAPALGACPSLLDVAMPALADGKPHSLCRYRGKVLLVVNTASRCGFTPQYAALERLWQRYRERGLVVLGFPSNDFGAQEPGSNAEIARFCELNYGVSFPMFEKSSVAGGSANPLFERLARASASRPRWNFHKYLVDRSGTKAIAFESAVAPEDPRLLAALERLLAERPAR